ncbi:MAG: phosphate ABC transporter ATP-binding protein [Chthoniobacter sp.]|uniref:phosphate ABC transporter ATP-binding protein n=1 Tax=Chthoniobacter sp. TaxID=2510640 RepID=UPI0032A193E2
MSDCCPPLVATDIAPILEARGLEVLAKGRALIRHVNFAVRPGQVFGLIGPSGAGKSTLLRALNRLTDLIPGLSVRGDVHLKGQSIYAPGTDVNALREKVGMLFQQPVVFPTTIAENVLFGAKRLRRLSRGDRAELIEFALTESALWTEVKDRLHQPATTLSVGQQQRLCLARTLAVKSEIILMDEPTSALDPKSTQAIEELIVRLKERHTIVIVTHNVTQARRLTDWIACVCLRDGVGEIVESACCDAVLDNPQCGEVIDYLAHA